MAVEIENPDSVVFNGDVRTNKKSKEITRRRRKQKKNKKQDNNNNKENSDPQQPLEIDEIEYITENLEFGDAYAELKSVFEKFDAKEAVNAEDDDDSKDEDEKKVTNSDSYEEEEQDANQNENGEVSNKKKKLQRRMKIAELKQLCARPDLVDVWDTTAANPKLLVFLKSYRNTVPVPRHWCQKMKFLQGKRGIEKQPLQLPDFISETGIEKIRQAYIEKEYGKKLKQKQRDRMTPKMGYMGIDYQVLRDAFFKYQTKPKLTSHCDLYHEGKEFEQVKLREMKNPGMLSQELKEVLSMQECERLINNMRRNMEIYEEEHVDRSKHWGDLEDEVESNNEVEDIPEEDLEEDTEFIDVIELRKPLRKEPERQLYQMFEEKEKQIAPGTLFGTTHTNRLELEDRRREQLAKRQIESMSIFYQRNWKVWRTWLKQHEDFSDMVAENEKKRKRKMHHKDGKSSKKKDFKF
ncbi:hypothetical protein MKW98_026458 [Papaver atlanticum]|uniref:DUF382 domain-containing protein n=1 Tax=Papaver atlanticum TaxID=357466 RepID=A0AAD4TD87_9MAGN|nr:hypothetical protein MKW98_026458 [Papaver atlanticum]